MTYANVTASLALFIALGGASYAAITFPARSVGNVQLRDGAVSKRVLSRPLQEAVAREGARGAQGPVGPAGATGPAGSPTGIELGGDLTGTFPNPTLRANTVGSAAVKDDALTGDDVRESSFGTVPTAHDAQTISGIAADDLVQGGGTLWRGHANPLQWTTAANGESRAILLSDVTPGPDDGLLVGIYCANNTANGSGANVVLANYGPGAINVLVDTGDGHPWLTSTSDGGAIYSNRLTTEHFFNETRRVVFQGIRDNGQAFFVSVIVQHQDDACRGAVIGHDTP